MGERLRLAEEELAMVIKARAITVHKSQGGTYSSIVYEYGKTHPLKLVYVALSRCTNLGNLYRTNTAGDHHFYHKETNVDRNMVDEFERLDKHRGNLKWKDTWKFRSPYFCRKCSYFV
ncbi:hypothetical protein HPB50_012447 [Hyalomma asiaticum]|uniref:Uncharacterized protein n=1 Tax=Hyalomma asiaticum TaxID=266040 RepID=A0ACB7S539_HYAAI|nr:hypothetical protein HPB50_012447 [Hyalomma asiaticum]